MHQNVQMYVFPQCPFYRGACVVVVDLLFIVAPIVREGSVFDPCFAIQYLLVDG